MSDGRGVLAPGFVGVADDHDHLSPERLRVFPRPFAGPHGITSSSQAKALNSMNISLPFDDEDLGCVLQLWQSVKDTSDVLQIPEPSSSTVGLTLREVFRFIANALKEKTAELVDVLVDVHDLPEVPPTYRLSVGPRRFRPSNDSAHLPSRSLTLAAG